MSCQSRELRDLLREVRERHGLNQRELAIRAGTSQDAISRIERGAENPTFERFEQILLAMGERVTLTAEPLQSPIPADELAATASMTPAERLREAMSWNRVTSELAIAGEKARGADHPATKLGPE